MEARGPHVKFLLQTKQPLALVKLKLIKLDEALPASAKP